VKQAGGETFSQRRREMSSKEVRIELSELRRKKGGGGGGINSTRPTSSVVVGWAVALEKRESVTKKRKYGIGR